MVFFFSFPKKPHKLAFSFSLEDLNHSQINIKCRLCTGIIHKKGAGGGQWCGSPPTPPISNLCGQEESLFCPKNHICTFHLLWPRYCIQHAAETYGSSWSQRKSLQACVSPAVRRQHTIMLIFCISFWDLNRSNSSLSVMQEIVHSRNCISDCIISPFKHYHYRNDSKIQIDKYLSLSTHTCILMPVSYSNTQLFAFYHCISNTQNKNWIK